MRIARIILAGIFICFLGLGLILGQEKQDKAKNNKKPPRPVEVKLNVKVLDAAGNLAYDLKTGDIKIFEDGVEQQITYFARKRPELNLGLVMDNSGSVRPQFKKLTVAGRYFVDSLTGAGEAFLIRFVNSERIEIIQDWTSNKTELNETLGDMFIEGGQSAVIDALYLAVEKLLEREKTDRFRKYAVVLISDIEDRNSYYDLSDVLALLKDSDIQVFIIGFTGQVNRDYVPFFKGKSPKEKSEDLAQTIALQSGGRVHILSKKYTGNELKTIAESISDELRYQYVIGYTSTNQNRDGLARKLRVEIANGEKGEKRQGSIRDSFIVPKN